MKKISIMVPCYNEEENVIPISEALIDMFAKDLPQYDYEILFIDNDSTLVPTQELAIQVCKQIDILCKNSELPYSSLFLIGDGNINRQIDSLKTKPSIVVGTPARILQLIKMKKLRVHDVKFLIIDEADRLIDKTYYESVITIRKSLMKYTQILMFSASIDKKTRKTANQLAYNPVFLDISKDTNEKDIIPKTIKHYYIISDRRERIETLRKIIKAGKPEKAMIFINSRYDLEESLQKLQYHNYNVVLINSANVMQ